MQPIAKKSLLRKLMAISGLAVAIMFSSNAFALASLPTSGTCGFIESYDYPFVYMYGASPGTGWGINFMGTINFTNKTISMDIVQENPAGSSTTETSTAFPNVPFTLSAGPITGTTTISFSLGGTAMTYNLLPVNGGQTVLMQNYNKTSGSQDGGTVGVCQF